MVQSHHVGAEVADYALRTPVSRFIELPFPGFYFIRHLSQAIIYDSQAAIIAGPYKNYNKQRSQVISFCDVRRLVYQWSELRQRQVHLHLQSAPAI